jgi:hypothetical protein
MTVAIAPLPLVDGIVYCVPNGRGYLDRSATQGGIGLVDVGDNVTVDARRQRDEGSRTVAFPVAADGSLGAPTLFAHLGTDRRNTHEGHVTGESM